jgi:hypothetical protein
MVAAFNERPAAPGGIGPSVSRMAAEIVKLVSAAVDPQPLQCLGDRTREVRRVLVEHRAELLKDRSGRIA